MKTLVSPIFKIWSCLSNKSLSHDYARDYLLTVHWFRALRSLIRMKHPPYCMTLWLYVTELEVPGARWDEHKLNSTENSIWNETCPGAKGTGIIMYKRHTHPISSQNNHRFKGLQPCKWKSFWEEPQGLVSSRGFTLKNFPQKLQTALKWALVKTRVALSKHFKSSSGWCRFTFSAVSTGTLFLRFYDVKDSAQSGFTILFHRCKHTMR